MFWVLSRRFKSISGSIIKVYLHNFGSYNIPTYEPTRAHTLLIMNPEMDPKHQHNTQDMNISKKEHKHLVNTV